MEKASDIIVFWGLQGAVPERECYIIWLIFCVQVF